MKTADLKKIEDIGRELADLGPHAWVRRAGKRILRELGCEEDPPSGRVEMLAHKDGQPLVIVFLVSGDGWWTCLQCDDTGGGDIVWGPCFGYRWRSLLEAQQHVRDAGWKLGPI